MSAAKSNYFHTNRHFFHTPRATIYLEDSAQKLPCIAIIFIFYVILL